MKTYVGIDNGSSGTIGIIPVKGEVQFGVVPNKFEQNYTKTARNITRIDAKLFMDLMLEAKAAADGNIFAVLERPFTNPKMFMTTLYAMRAFEAVLCIIEALEIPYQYIDSKEWQKALLPAGLKGADKLKPASLQIGNRLFPSHKSNPHPDRDGLLIAEFARRNKL